MNGQLLFLHFPADRRVRPCQSAAHRGWTCLLAAVIFSLCPLDGVHAPLCNPKQLNSRSLSAVLKCPATRCTQQQHLNEEAAQFKWCRLTYGPEREKWEAEIEGGWGGQSVQMMLNNILYFFFPLCILLCALHLFIYLFYTAPVQRFDWLWNHRNAFKCHMWTFPSSL